MKSIKIEKNVAFFESTLTVAQIKEAAKFAPESLEVKVKDERGNVNTLFAINTSRHTSELSSYYATFVGEDNDNAYITYVSNHDKDLKNVIFENFYNAIQHITVIEEQVKTALYVVSENRKAFDNMLKGVK